MASIVNVRLGKRSYQILIGSGILRSLGSHLKKLNLGTDAYIITNPLIKKHYGSIISGALKQSRLNFRFALVPDSEKSKSINIAVSLIKDLAAFDRKKKVFIIAFGGGVIGDLAGLIAAIYKRGVPYVQVPTTLLAQVDSAIGGKTALDMACGKNLIGAFYQPRLVLSDVRLLDSLSPRQIRSGLAEVIKYGIIKDPELFSFIEREYRGILAHKNAPLEHIVKCCSAIKARVVEQDEREEREIRTILNFGHTVGHALEAATGFSRYAHGEALAIGMLVASGISRKLGFIGGSLLERIEALIRKVGLPTQIKGASLSAVIKAHYRDKKFIAGKNRLVLTMGLGRTKIVEGVPLQLIKKAVQARIS